MRHHFVALAKAKRCIQKKEKRRAGAGGRVSGCGRVGGVERIAAVSHSSVSSTRMMCAVVARRHYRRPASHTISPRPIDDPWLFGERLLI